MKKGLHNGLKPSEYRVPKTSKARKRATFLSSPTGRYKSLRPCERLIKEKKQEKSKCDEANAKRKELEETSAKIKDPAFSVGNTSQRCSIKKCHEQNHKVCTC